MMVDPNDIARYFLWLACEESEPEPITNMRLQKLLYYAQGWALAVRGRPLFEGTIEGWIHGPVIREVYRTFAKYNDDVISRSEAADSSILSRDDAEFVNAIWESYKAYSASELRRRTHSERPWLEARAGLGPDDRGDRVILDETMRTFFRAEYDRRALSGLSLAELETAAEDLSSGRGIKLGDAKIRLNNAI